MNNTQHRIRSEFAAKLDGMAKGMLVSVRPDGMTESLEKSAENIGKWMEKAESCCVLLFKDKTFFGSAYFDFTGNGPVISGISPAARDFFRPLISMAEACQNELEASMKG